MKKTMIAVSMAVAATGLATFAQAAENYPERSIEFIVPYGPGGGSDNVVRALQPKIEEALGGTLVIRNISGGGGAVGYNRAVNAAADGYTVTTPNNANFTLEGLGNVDFTYGDFEYIARVLVEPYILAVRQNDDWTDFESLMESIEAGNRLSVGFSGVGSSTHVTAVAIGEELGVDFNFIPFDGGSAAVSAAMGGHVDAVVLNPNEILSAVEGGRLNPMLSTGEDRTDIFPDTPTMVELGYELELNQWRGIAAPKGISQEIEDKWVEAVKHAVEDPAFQRFAKEGGSEVMPLFGEELDEFVRRTADLMIPIAQSVQE
ncbi:Bug family tripartite tricarboxylate transporter substrate binding protein [Halomonas chromatireducens]|uniref:Tripartite tricarboxylate transporter family receptor n=1 Tax=Halomonas chromatireducens TaxID=507626 RepID=A0A0X8HC21_9GAMM|nr:tripartite tricarboxylate transporter substrate binding protein [Halomonas chromatireducens]AMC99878.1 Tripartite tricarboxylate transporter family receptor [Halomonas chromatireducens]